MQLMAPWINILAGKQYSNIKDLLSQWKGWKSEYETEHEVGEKVIIEIAENMRNLTGIKACHQVKMLTISNFFCGCLYFQGYFLSPLFGFLSVSIIYFHIHLSLTSEERFI